MTGPSQALVFPCRGDTLVGVLDLPPGDAETAVLVVVGGPQYRAGSHRQFVLLARRLRASGRAVLRFDHRGMGDSEGTPPGFEHTSEDIGAAIDALRERLPSLRRLVLWGLCDGASAALLYCERTRDPRVTGLCLVNPWVRSEQIQARVQVKHYYTRRILQREFWRKLASGAVGFSSLRELARSVWTSTRRARAAASFQERMARGWHAFGGPALVVLSGDDYTAKEFVEYTRASAPWSALLRRPDVQVTTVDDADHTFSADAARRRCEDATLAWLDRCAAPVTRS